MGDKLKSLVNYAEAACLAAKLVNKIADVEANINSNDYIFENVSDNPSLEKKVGEKLHQLRIKNLELKLRLNSLEKQMLEFELESELAD